MCGITGILAFNAQGQQKLNLLSKAVYSLQKRGPDHEGIYYHNNVAIGHRRLSIIDTSDTASQPFTDDTGRYTIVFNGEIYNYRELKKSIEQKGIKFRSQSDTEVLLQLYILEKEKCLQHLEGDFSFAVYDNQLEQLFIARDRFGIKPLFFYQTKNEFIFGSELKALFEFGVVKKINREALLTYLHLNYIPAPLCMISGVQKLLPGQNITIQKNGTIDIKKYYEIPYTENTSTLPYPDAEKKLHELLDASVQRRMISDVPLGCFLSGGIDSSIIAALASKHTNHLKTFSIGYKDEPMFDETAFAKLVAKKHNTDHTVFSLSNNDLYASLFDILEYMSEPFADSSAIAVYILSKETRKQVTVALSGDGADEMFGGYNKHQALLFSQKNKFVHAAKYLTPLLKAVPKSRNNKFGNKIRQMQKLGKGMRMNYANRYWRWAGFTDEKELFQLLKKNPAALQHQYKEFVHHITGELTTDFNTTLLTDMQLVLPNDMLVKADLMSMANSLEIRVPFLDHNVVDFAFSLPSNYKLDKKNRKKILKSAFANELPPEILTRGKKGFEVPLLNWFKTELRSLIFDDLLSDQFITEQDLFNLTEIQKLKNQLLSNNPDDAVARIWALIVFQYWWRKNLS